MLLYYIRHGDPIYEPDQLTPLGQEQARAVAKRLARYGIDQIYTSTSNRAIQTAQPLCDLLKKESVQLDWCNEKYAHRALSAMTEDGKKIWAVDHPEMRRFLNSPEIKQMGENWYEHPKLADTNFKEGILRFNRETDAFLETLGYCRNEEQNCYIAEKPNEQRIALFAHWGVGGAIMSHILGIPYPQFALHFSIGHSAVSVIEFRERAGMVIPQALTYANDSHIYREGLPTKFVNRIYI